MTYADRHAKPLDHAPGEVVLSARKSLWIFGWSALWLGGAPWATTGSAVVVWAVSTAVCLCLGHSVGLHRGVIHRAFRMHPTTERVLVWLAIQCGMDGPISMVAMHETRDGWQNRPEAPAYYAYRHRLATDFAWYLLMIHRPQPGQWQAEVPAEVANDPYYRWLQRWWRWQLLPVAIGLFAVGGISWLVWGVAGRITTAIVGHWLVNFYAHTEGELAYTLPAGEEGRNNALFGFVSMGEAWHNNHHAFPRSARIGIAPGQLDPGWWAIQALQWMGLVWDVQLPGPHTLRAGARATAQPGPDGVDDDGSGTLPT